MKGKGREPVTRQQDRADDGDDDAEDATVGRQQPEQAVAHGAGEQEGAEHPPADARVGLPRHLVGLDDLPAAVTWLEAQGVRFTPGGIRKGAAGFDVCFIHPKGSEASPRSGCGVLIELVQAPQAVVDAFDAMSAAGG